MCKISKISCLAVIFFFSLIFAVQAKINMFPKPRYIPELSFYGDSGKAYKLKDFKSDLLMAVVWSKRCGPCISDLKHLNAFAKKTAGKGINIILISPAKEWQTTDERKTFLKRIGAGNLVSYSDKDSNFMKGMGILVTPTVILVNKENEEAGQITGSVKWDDPEVVEYMLQLKKDMLKNLNQEKSAD